MKEKRFIPCLMEPSKPCDPSCPNHKDAKNFRKELESVLKRKFGRNPTEQEMINTFKGINPLTAIISAPAHLANTCPNSKIRKVTTSTKQV